MAMVTELDSNQQLQKLAIDVHFDTEYSITLKLREWLIIAAIWYSHGGEAQYLNAKRAIEEASAALSIMLPEACMGFCASTLGHKSDCQHERETIEPILLGFIDMAREG